jgi:hypothetical protein
MEKEALDLLNLALLSLITGGGAYAGMRGIKDLATEGKPAEKPKNELEITLPASRIPKMASDETGVNSYFLPAVTGILGLGGGFMGASSLYEKIKKKHLENQLQNTEHDYLKTLEQARTKLGSIKTPATDAFLTGLFDAIGSGLKKEGFFDTSNTEFLGKDGPLATGANQIKHMGNAFFDTEIGKMSGAAMLLTALLGGGATYGIAKKMDDDKENLKSQQNLPTDIRLHVTK